MRTRVRTHTRSRTHCLYAHAQFFYFCSLPFQTYIINGELALHKHACTQMEKHRRSILAHLLQGVSVIPPLMQPFFAKKVSLTSIFFFRGRVGWQWETWPGSLLFVWLVSVGGQTHSHPAAEYLQIPSSTAHVVFCSSSPIDLSLYMRADTLSHTHTPTHRRMFDSMMERQEMSLHAPRSGLTRWEAKHRIKDDPFIPRNQPLLFLLWQHTEVNVNSTVELRLHEDNKPLHVN